MGSFFKCNVALISLMLFSSVNAEEIRVERFGERKVYFGYQEGKLATNFDKNGNYQALSWEYDDNTKVSNKAYISDKDLKPNSLVKFCISSNVSNKVCSPYEQHESRSYQRAASSSNNEAALDIKVLEPEKLGVGVEPISVTSFRITNGEPVFIYSEHLDQNDRVLDSNIVYETLDTFLQGQPMDVRTSSFKACSIGGFLYSEPTILENCTPTYTEFKSPIFGQNIGNRGDFSSQLNLFIRHGAAIDGIGYSDSDYVGFDGGSRSYIDLNRVKQVKVTTGNYKFAANNKKIVSMQFLDVNGSVIGTYGNGWYSSNKRTYTFSVPNCHKIDTVTGWSSGYLLDGIQFSTKYYSGLC